jgi:hypothetical protein
MDWSRVRTVATLTSVTAALVAAAAITDGVSIVASLLVSAAIGTAVWRRDAPGHRAARLETAARDMQVATREMVRALGEGRAYERGVEGLIGLVMQKVAGRDAVVIAEMHAVADLVKEHGQMLTDMHKRMDDSDAKVIGAIETAGWGSGGGTVLPFRMP